MYKEREVDKDIIRRDVRSEERNNKGIVSNVGDVKKELMCKHPSNALFEFDRSNVSGQIKCLPNLKSEHINNLQQPFSGDCRQH